MRRVLAAVLAGALVGSVLVAGVASAGQARVPVCHLEGNGTYNLIEVAEPAYLTHIGHGDAAIGEPVPAMPGYIFDDACQPTEALLLDAWFDAPIGITTADASGLTYEFDGMVLTDASKVYTEALWGTYPLYLPGTTVNLVASVENLGATTTDTLTLVTAGYSLNLDGSNGAAIISPPMTIGYAFAPGVTQVPIDFVLPASVKALNVVYLELDLGGSLLAHHEAVFCPPPLD